MIPTLRLRMAAEAIDVHKVRRPRKRKDLRCKGLVGLTARYLFYIRCREVHPNFHLPHNNAANTPPRSPSPKQGPQSQLRSLDIASFCGDYPTSRLTSVDLYRLRITRPTYPAVIPKKEPLCPSVDDSMQPYVSEVRSRRIASVLVCLGLWLCDLTSKGLL